VPRLCGFYTGICPTTEEKARKNLSQGVRKLVEYCELTVYRRFRAYTGRYLRNAGTLIADYATSSPQMLASYLRSSYRSQEPLYHESSLSASYSHNGQPTTGKVTHSFPPSQNNQGCPNLLPCRLLPFLYLLAIARLARPAITQNMSIFSGSTDQRTLRKLSRCVHYQTTLIPSHTTLVYFN
jgi:hypothetical protein